SPRHRRPRPAPRLHHAPRDARELAVVYRSTGRGVSPHRPGPLGRHVHPPGEAVGLRAVVLRSPREMSLTERPEPPPPGEGEALVRVLRVGVCGTDLHAFHGDQPMVSYPRVLGHELAVEVLTVGPR